MKSDLRIFCSARVKLSPEQRQALKDSYRRLQSESAPPVMPAVMPGSSISVQNAPVQTDINRRLGLPNIVVLDLLSSREAISLPTVLMLQRELGVEVITDDELRASFNEYLEYLHSNVTHR